MDPSLPPSIQLYQLATAHYHSQAVYVAAELGIADHLAEGPRDAEALAEATQTHAPSLERVLRFLVALGVFTERDGAFGLTPLSEALRSGPGSARPSVRLFAGPMQWKTWGDLLTTVRTGEPAFERVHGQPSFEYLAANPEEGENFDAAMSGFSSAISHAVASGYDFSKLSRVLDVGGGDGGLLLGLLDRNPHLEGDVFDLPRVREAAERNIAGSKTQGRCGFVGGDFFESVPAGYDAYLSKHVIHDWDDDQAAAILRQIRKAIGDTSGRLLLIEGVYPDRVDASARGAAANDCNMLVATGGKQRTRQQFEALYQAAGFTLHRILPCGMTSIIEGTPV